MNNRYIEFDSTYRNRNIWPNPAEFEINISQSGTKTKIDALDPISLSTPINVWSGSNLSITSTGPTGSISVLLSTSTNPVNNTISNLSDNKTYTISNNTGDFSVNFQQKYKYYTNLVFAAVKTGGTPNSNLRRINDYKYLLSTGPTGAQYSFAQITSDITLSDYISPGPTSASIADPTDLSDKTNPYIYVPSGLIAGGSYTDFLLYNESLNEYRTITGYDIDTHLVSLDTTGITSYNSGPLSILWSRNNNFSIRQEPPIVPLPATMNPQILNTTVVANGKTYISSSSIVILSITSTPYLNIVTNNYKNDALRIIPNNSSIVVPGSPQYYTFNNNGQLSIPFNESNIISSSFIDDTGTNLVIVMATSFSVNPINLYCEILAFSYDNYSPLVYNGSIVSQNEAIDYEIGMNNLVLPNLYLKNPFGARIAFYNYLYVVISNVSSSSSHLKNIIYSNNPNSTKAIFRCVISERDDPTVNSFANISADNMVQTIKFKPNDNLYFAVVLPDGEIFKTIEPETYSPETPNPRIQISASFSIKRIIKI